MRIFSPSFRLHLIRLFKTETSEPNCSLKRKVQTVKKTTKIILTSAASLLGVALATGGAFAATGSIDAPGQTLKTSGVAPAAAHANATALTHANAHARGLLGTPASSTDDTAGTSSGASTTDITTPISPVAPSIASKDASTVKGRLTGEEISAWAHEHATVHAVVPDAGISVEADMKANTHAKH